MLPQPPLWLVLIAFICALGPLVFFHELGHFLVARWFRIPAETFSIGFGREIFGWTDRRGTRWKVGWLPLGGYVKFIGDMGPSSEPADLSHLTPEQRANAFQTRPVWQRFLVVLAGPATNFLLAIVIFAIFFAAFGVPRSPNVVGQVRAGSPAAQAGIRAGDRLVSVDGTATGSFEDLQREISLRPGAKVSVAVERQGKTVPIDVTVGSYLETDQFGQKHRIGLLGVQQGERIWEKPSPLMIIPEATRYTAVITRAMAEGLWQIISGRRGTEDIGGPIKIAQIAGQQATLGALPFVQLLALFSINLGFINLLPVPMLDGGHLLFYAVEAVRRRPLSARALDFAFRGGLALILALVLFTTLNDLGSLGLWDRLQRLIG